MSLFLTIQITKMGLAIKALKYLLLLLHISLTLYTNEVSSASHVTPPPASRAKTNPRLVAVQGVIYCKSCKYSGVDTLVGASPLQGATVRLACNYTKGSYFSTETKTDKNGYFFILGPKTLTTKAVHTCRAWPTNTSPTPATKTCTVLTQLNNGTTGAMLKPSKSINIGEYDYVLFNVGPFAFEPVCKR